jgi:hypothetical protein
MRNGMKNHNQVKNHKTRPGVCCVQANAEKKYQTLQFQVFYGTVKVKENKVELGSDLEFAV